MTSARHCVRFVKTDNGCDFVFDESVEKSKALRLFFDRNTNCEKFGELCLSDVEFVPWTPRKSAPIL